MYLFIFNYIYNRSLYKIILFYLNYSKQSIVNKIFVKENSVRDLLAKLYLAILLLQLY